MHVSCRISRPTLSRSSYLGEYIKLAAAGDLNAVRYWGSNVEIGCYCAITSRA